MRNKRTTRTIAKSLLGGIVICVLLFAPLFFTATSVSTGTAFAQPFAPTAAQVVIDGGPDGFLASISNNMLTVAGWFTGTGGLVLNQAAKVSVIDMSDLVDNAVINIGTGNVSAIEIAWTVLRDVGNIVIIFSLLVIGIATILRYSSYGMKALLVRLIIVALLINFSLFFTKVIIDTGNIITFHFYNAITQATPGCDPDDEYDACLSNAFVDRLKLTSIYDIKNRQEVGIGFEGIEPGDIFIAGVMGSAFLLVTAFVFFAAGILLLIRLVVLILLMILSPLALAGMIIPYTQKYAQQWWNTLFSQVFFAPLLFLFFWITLIITASLQNVFNTQANINLEQATFGAAFNGDSVAIITNFIIITIFMIASLILARQMGAVGSKTLIDWGNNARKWGQGFAGRNTIGRLSRRIDNRVARTRFGASGFGQAVRRGTTGALAGAKFGSTENLADVDKKNEADLDRTIDRVKHSPQQLARFLSAARGSHRDYIYSKLSARDRVAAEKHITEPILRESLRASLTEEEREKTQKALRDAETREISRLLRNSIDAFVNTGSTNPVTISTDGTSHTYTTIQQIVEALPTKNARDLNDAARRKPEIIQNLSTSQLDDLMREGNLTPDQIETIRDTINGEEYPPELEEKQKSQKVHISSSNRKTLWGV